MMSSPNCNSSRWGFSVCRRLAKFKACATHILLMGDLDDYDRILFRKIVSTEEKLLSY